ncbi:MAG: hypothetical protein HY283_10620 [Nitrospirae bacterium]|nr:hypothetical protein [Nitrospirota bacterium]
MTGIQGKETVRSGHSHPIWRYLVPSSALKEVLVLENNLGPDKPDAVNGAAHVSTLALDFGRTAPFPFEDGRFDLVILTDYGRAGGRGGDLGMTLRECRRVLAAGAYLYMTADNRLRTRSSGLTLSGFRKNIERAGIGPSRWWACFPDGRQPKYVMDLDGRGPMDYFVSAFLNLDIRTGSLIRRVNRLAGRLGIAPYLAPGYAVLVRKDEMPAREERS